MPLSGDMRQAVFLDRDGVINKAILKNGHPLSPRKMEQLEIILYDTITFCSILELFFKFN